MNTILETIPIKKIDFSAANPRGDAADDLEGMAASLGSEEAPMLVNPPVLRKLSGGRYQVVAGERRVRAAQLAGWKSIPCQVRTDLDACQMHNMRVVENLHRRDLHPLDEATALKITWLLANADALKVNAKAVLEKEGPGAQTLAELEALLLEAGFVPTHPAVPWDSVLDQLGVEMKADNRKKLMRVLSLAPDVQEQARGLDLTAAALRSLGSLEEEAQRTLVGEVTAEPELGRKVRRIARVVRDGTHSLDEAIAEAKGQVSASTDEPPEPASQPMPEDERVTDQVIALLEAATGAQAAVDELKTLLGPDYLTNLPGAWGEYAREAIAIFQVIVEE